MIWNTNFGRDLWKEAPFCFNNAQKLIHRWRLGFRNFIAKKIIPVGFYAKHAFLFAEKSCSKWLQEIL